MDIGYGNCTPYPFETAISIQLCICSTNNCTATYSTCQASVNQELASPPPLIPVLQPTLSNSITCLDTYANYSAVYNITSAMYSGCSYLITFGEANTSACYSYVPNHTLICGLYYDPKYGNNEQMAMIEGSYELWMNSMVISAALTNLNSSLSYVYQTSTSIAVIVFNSFEQLNTRFCFCITNNCNLDFSTCTDGMNIPSYFWAINGSTSVTSTALATSTSGATNISSGSTLVPTTTISTIQTPMSPTTSAKSFTTTMAQFQNPFLVLLLQITMHIIARLSFSL